MVHYDLIIATDKIYKGEHRVTGSGIDHISIFGKEKSSAEHTLRRSYKSMDNDVGKPGQVLDGLNETDI